MWHSIDAPNPVLHATYGKATKVRMLAFGLRGGGLCVVSPGTWLSPDDYAELERHGTLRFLLAPNHFHTLGLAAWHARYPEAKLVAHPRAHKRLQGRVPGVTFGDLGELEALMPEGARLLCPPTAKQGETWVSLPVAEGRAWFVTDGILNEVALPAGLMGVMMRLLGFRSGLVVNAFFLRMFSGGRAAFLRWTLEQLDKDPPQVFVPSHGEILHGADVAQRLRDVVGEALNR